VNRLRFIPIPLLVSLAAPSGAALLGSYAFTSFPFLLSDPIDLDVCIETGDFQVPPGRDYCVHELGGAVLFDSLVVDAQDNGSTFTADAENDPGFAQAVALLTNGSDDTLFIGFLFSPLAKDGIATRESYAFGDDTGGVDFAGLTIDSIRLVLGPDFFDGGGIEVQVFGVPEPATATLLAIGLVPLAASRRAVRR